MASRRVRRPSGSRLVRSVGLIAVAWAAVWVAGAGAQQAVVDDRAIAHVLDRVTFGARPGDVARVRAMGVAAFLDAQLHPDAIDDAAMDARLAGFETLQLSSREIAERYALPQLQMRRELQRNQDGQQAGRPDGSRPDGPPGNADPRQRPEVRDAAMAALRGQQVVLGELTEQKLLRAVYSERQLQEVLVDFWFNHFNVFAGKGVDRYLLTAYERDAIRPHVLGRFRDLLGEVAHSPAMLFYLDNWMSVDPEAASRLNARRQNARRGRFGAPGRGAQPGDPANPTGARGLPIQAQQRRTGLNENYARELLELHTLGVDGGYTQQDVVEVARVFTGWTILAPRVQPEFQFQAALHDPGDKVVLGRAIAGGGEDEGERVLDLLARHPATARLVATKLARRFVSDEPPPALVDRAARRFLETDGDLREVVRTILASPEFLAEDAYRAKVRTPFEFVVAAVRATGADVARARGLAAELRNLGMPLYQSEPPTGYADTADAWVNTGALIGRMNFAVSLTGNALPGVRVDLGALGGSGSSAGLDATRDRLLAAWLHGNASPATVETLRRAEAPAQLAALAIGSPEFQRR